MKAVLSRAEADIARAATALSPVAARLSRRDYGPPSGRAGRAADALCALALSAVLCELLQFAALLTLGWLLGAECGPLAVVPIAPGGDGRVSGAARAALASRGLTRPVRLAAEVLGYRAALRLLRERRAAERAALAVRRVLIAGAATAALVGLLAIADAALLTSGGGLPLARTCSWLHSATLGVALPALGASVASPREVERSVGALAAALVGSAEWLGGGVVNLAQAARTVKPLRAILDLTESDAWVADGAVGLASKLPATLHDAVGLTSKLLATLHGASVSVAASAAAVTLDALRWVRATAARLFRRVG